MNASPPTLWNTIIRMLALRCQLWKTVSAELLVISEESYKFAGWLDWKEVEMVEGGK